MLKVLSVLFSFTLLLVGCSSNEEATKEETVQETASKENKEVKEEQKQASQDIKQNEELTKKLAEEKAVEKGNVYEKDNVVYGTFMVDKEISDKDVKGIVEKYTEELQAEYGDKKVSVQAVKEGRVIEEATVSVGEPVIEEGKKTAEQLNAEVVNVIIGVYGVKVDLEAAKSVNATETSELVIEMDKENTVSFEYEPEQKAFVAVVQGRYTKDDILKSAVSVK